MKFCQARLSPPLIGQLIAEASIEGTEQYSRDVYDEYVERRKCLIDGVNRIPGCYTPVPRDRKCYHWGLVPFGIIFKNATIGVLFGSIFWSWRLDSLKEFSLFVLVSWVGSISYVLGVMSLFWCWLGSLILGLAFVFLSEALFV